jgi:hypothetical protein
VELTPGTTNLLHVAHGAEIIPFHTLALGGALTGAFVNDGELQMGLSAPMPPQFPVDLLNGGVFANVDGMGDPRFNLLYGARVIETVALNGSFTQNADGHLDFDVAFGPYPSDRINATGAVSVNGTGDVILTWLQDKHPVTIIATPGTAVNNGLKIDSNLAVDFQVIATNGVGVQIVPLTHFGNVPGAHLNNNEEAVGRQMDSAIDVGGSAGVGRLLAFLGNIEAGQEALYKHVMSELNPEPLVAPLHAQIDEANSFGRELFTCDPMRGMIEHDCAWARIESADERDRASFQYLGVDRASTDTRGGWQRPIEGPWSFALEAGYQSVNRLSVDNGRAAAHGGGGQFGAGFERRTADDLEFDAGLSGGWSEIGVDRHQTVFNIGIGHSTIRTEDAQLRFDAAKTVWMGSSFVKPSLGLTVTELRTDSFAETGLQGLGWKSAGGTKAVAAAEPKLTFGTMMSKDALQETFFHIDVGGRFSSTSTLQLPFSFEGAGQGTHPALITTPYDQSVWTVGAGLTIKGSGRMKLDLDYNTEFGPTATSQRGGLDLKITF